MLSVLPLMTGTRHIPPIPVPQVPRTVHKQGHRPTKGAWVQYGKFCYTATGTDSWSHDAVYAQNPLLERAVGTKVHPKAEIMDVTQGSGKKVSSGEATKLRQANYTQTKALIAGQMIQDLRIQKSAVRIILEEVRARWSLSAHWGMGGLELLIAPSQSFPHSCCIRTHRLQGPDLPSRPSLFGSSRCRRPSARPRLVTRAPSHELRDRGAARGLRQAQMLPRSRP